MQWAEEGRTGFENPLYPPPRPGRFGQVPACERALTHPSRGTRAASLQPAGRLSLAHADVLFKNKESAVTRDWEVVGKGRFEKQLKRKQKAVTARAGGEEVMGVYRVRGTERAFGKMTRAPAAGQHECAWSRPTARFRMTKVENTMLCVFYHNDMELVGRWY